MSSSASSFSSSFFSSPSFSSYGQTGLLLYTMLISQLLKSHYLLFLRFLFDFLVVFNNLLRSYVNGVFILNSRMLEAHCTLKNMIPNSYLGIEDYWQLDHHIIMNRMCSCNKVNEVTHLDKVTPVKSKYKNNLTPGHYLI